MSAMGRRSVATVYGCTGSTTPDTFRSRRYDPLLGSGLNLPYLGQTSCIEVHARDGHSIILDGGTGLRRLGNVLERRWAQPEYGGKKNKAHLIFTHHHLDHLNGGPFFTPGYREGNEFTMVNSEGSNGTLRDIICSHMGYPKFPVEFDQLQARFNFVNVTDGEEMEIGETTLKFAKLGSGYHVPDGVLSVRLMHDGKGGFVYATDIEVGKNPIDRLVEHAQGADTLVHDAQYTTHQYRSRKGWGHSTPRDAVTVASEAGAKNLILFHHDPNATPKGLVRGILGEAMKYKERKGLKYPREIYLAYEGMRLAF